ncbi:MAG: cysteine desulfurase family protein [Proteobacteria bacterium]|nr:cysteine desulfurase family protein [Pseudomonadota bacterium]
MTAAAAYLDYNATTPVKRDVADVVAEVLATGGNPSSVHRFGRLARAALDRARDEVAALAGVDPDAVVFTSGGTEANALAVASFAARGVARLLIAGVEHDSVLAAAAHAGPEVKTLPVLPSGIVDLAALDALLADVRASGGRAGVAVQLANNETGVIQPVAEIAARVHAAGGLLHCDAVQGPGRIAVNIPALGADTAALSAHKFGGPQGVGALVAPEFRVVSPVQTGGGQERGLRAGTENVAGIAGFGRAAVLAADDLAEAGRLAAMRDGLERRLQTSFPGARVYGAEADRLPNTSCIAMAGMRAETQVIALDLAGVAVSAGAACSSGKVRASHVLRAMGADEDEAGSAIRVSLGWASSQHDVDRFAAAWSELAARRAHGQASIAREGM